MEDPKPEDETQESQEPYEAADSGALETADPEVGYVPEFMGLNPKEDEPDEAEAESSPGTEEQADEADEQRTEGEEESPDAADPTGKRYADQQKRADLAENRIKELETTIKETEQVQPIVQFVQNDPALRQAFNQRLSGQDISIDAPPTVPDKPLEPTRPANYSKDDAINEPESDSAKFDLAIQNYPGEVERWRENKEQFDTKKANEQTLVLKQEQFMADFNASLKDLGAAEDEIASVLTFSQNEDYNTTANIAKALLGMYRDSQISKPEEKPTGETPTDQAAQAAATAAARTQTSPKPEIVDETEEEKVEGVAVREWQQNWEKTTLLQRDA